MGRIIFGTILVLLGLDALIGLSLFKIAFAILIIALGIRVLVGKRHRWKWNQKISSNEDLLNEVAVFSPLNKTIKSKEFEGGKVVMVFAGGEINLSKAETSKKEINLELVTVLSSCKLIVPKDWKVNLKGAAILGDNSNNTVKNGGSTTLIIKGSTVLGSLEIMN